MWQPIEKPDFDRAVAMIESAISMGKPIGYTPDPRVVLRTVISALTPAGSPCRLLAPGVEGDEPVLLGMDTD